MHRHGLWHCHLWLNFALYYSSSLEATLASEFPGQRALLMWKCHSLRWTSLLSAQCKFCCSRTLWVVWCGQCSWVCAVCGCSVQSSTTVRLSPAPLHSPEGVISLTWALSRQALEQPNGVKMKQPCHYSVTAWCHGHYRLYNGSLMHYGCIWAKR